MHTQMYKSKFLNSLSNNTAHYVTNSNKDIAILLPNHSGSFAFLEKLNEV